MFSKLRNLYDATIELSNTKKAIYALAFVAFLESSIFPIPPDVMLIPMILANRQNAFLYASVCTIFSVLGGVAGYFIGAVFYDSLGTSIISFYGYENGFDHFKALYDEHGSWIVGMAGVTPFPYKVITILSGIAAMDLINFISISTLARGVRFFALAILLWFFGTPIRNFIDRYFALLTIIFFLIIVSGFFILKWVI